MTRAKWAYLVGLRIAVSGPLGLFWISERYGRVVPLVRGLHGRDVPWSFVSAHLLSPPLPHHMLKGSFFGPFLFSTSKLANGS